MSSSGAGNLLQGYFLAPELSSYIIMDRLCNSGKSLMASTECSASPEMIASTINEPLNYAHGAINKRVRITTPQDLQVMFHNVLKRPDMFGLRLTKTNSLIDSVHAILCEATPSVAPPAARDVSCEVDRSRESNSSSKLKATNFFASLLKIGDWKFVPRFNDLMAKCYFAKHKLVWEILQDGLKSKMEIPWSHITAIKATFSGSGGTLDIALAKPPLFFREHNPQPKKHTSWKECADFTTNGQASTNRWHHLECSNGLELKKNFEKLISCDPRLKALSQQQDFPYSNPLYPCFANQGIPNSHGLHGATVTELASPASTITDKSDACKCSDEMPNSQKLDAPSTCSGIDALATEVTRLDCFGVHNLPSRFPGSMSQSDMAFSHLPISKQTMMTPTVPSLQFTSYGEAHMTSTMDNLLIDSHPNSGVTDEVENCFLPDDAETTVALEEIMTMQ